MTGKHYASQALILSKKNYKEADKLLTLFAKDFGKITILAKSARLPKSRKRGALEIGNIISFQATHAHGFDILTEVSLVESFPNLKTDLRKLSVAYFLLEVILKLTQAEEKNEELFDLVYQALADIQNGKNLKKLREAFVTDVLVLLGYWPEGKELLDPDKLLLQVAEREFGSVRVGKRILTRVE